MIKARSMDSSKDIILAVLGGSVSLAGLLLIFAGFLFSQAAGFDSNTSDTLINKYRRAAQIGVIPFLLCLGLAGVSIYWLRFPGGELLSICFYGFIALLVITAIYGALSILFYL